MRTTISPEQVSGNHGHLLHFNFYDFNDNSLSDSKIKQLLDLMKKKCVSHCNQTLQFSRELTFYHSIKEDYSPSVYLDSTWKNPLRTQEKSLKDSENVATTYVLKQLDTTKSLSLKEYVPSVVVIKLWTKPISYQIVRDLPRWETYSFKKLKQKLMIFANHRVKIWYRY